MTSREQNIFNMLLDGTSPKEIAYKLNISYHTVDYHRSKLYRKLGVQNIHELFAKYSQGRNALNPVEPAESFSKNKTKKLFILFIPAIILILIAFILSGWYFFIKPSSSISSGITITSEKNPLILTMNDNEPWGYVIQFNPFVSKNTKITAGDIYTFSYSFISSADIDTFYLYFVDRTSEENGSYFPLSSHALIKGNVIADIEYSGSTTIIATKNASSTDPHANLVCITAIPYTANQPIITFTRFEIVKSN